MIRILSQIQQLSDDMFLARLLAPRSCVAGSRYNYRCFRPFSRPTPSLLHPPMRIASLAAMSTNSSAPSPPQLTHVKVTTEPGIATITYNRPTNANALNVATLKDLLAALQYTESNADIRVIITTGAGKFYTAGLDLLDPSNSSPTSTINEAFLSLLSDIHVLLINTPKLHIAAVNGPAPGWGTSSLALCDLVYSTRDAIFFTPFVQWGLCAEACSSVTFRSIMGRQKAAGLILAGQRMGAEDMERAGLVTKVIDVDGHDDDGRKGEVFMQKVLEVARSVAALPPKSLRLNKELMMRGYREELLQANKIELELLREQCRGEESRKAINGFRDAQEKRKKAKTSKL